MEAGGRSEALQFAYLRHPVLLHHEPDNPYDRNAIAVFLGREVDPLTQVGYIPKDVAARLRLPGDVLGEVADIRFHPDDDRRVAGIDVSATIDDFYRRP